MFDGVYHPPARRMRSATRGRYGVLEEHGTVPYSEVTCIDQPNTCYCDRSWVTPFIAARADDTKLQNNRYNKGDRILTVASRQPRIGHTQV